MRVCAGKTVMLLLQGLRWLQSGNDVHVVAWQREARAASVMLAHQLRLANAALNTSPNAGSVVAVFLDTDVQAMAFAQQLQGTKPFVLIDEADFNYNLSL